MKFAEFFNHLEEMKKTVPGIDDMTVITCIDDEGNGYNPVVFTPSIGVYDEGEFDSEVAKDEANTVLLN